MTGDKEMDAALDEVRALAEASAQELADHLHEIEHMDLRDEPLTQGQLLTWGRARFRPNNGSKVDIDL